VDKPSFPLEIKGLPLNKPCVASPYGHRTG
jgi:hypothetical protein